MIAAQFFSGAFLFALLIVEICCLPFKPVPQMEPSVSQPTWAGAGGAGWAGAGEGGAGWAGLEHAGAGSTGLVGGTGPAGAGSSGTVLVGYKGSSVSPPNPDYFARPGAAFKGDVRDLNWAVPLPTLLSGDEDTLSSGSRGGDASSTGFVSPPIPQYQAGELSHFEVSTEAGDSQRETEEQGFPSAPGPRAPHAAHEAAGSAWSAGSLGHAGEGAAGFGFTSESYPRPGVGGGWGLYPYYYDYAFLTGQYPPGTVTHSSSNYEQGGNYWDDAHYVRYYPRLTPVPYNPPRPVKTVKQAPIPQAPKVQSQFS